MPHSPLGSFMDGASRRERLARDPWDSWGLTGGGLLGDPLGAHLALSAGPHVGSRNRNRGSSELLIKSRRWLQGHCPLPPAL